MERKLVLVKFIDGTSETIEAYCSSRGGYYGYLTKKELLEKMRGALNG